MSEPKAEQVNSAWDLCVEQLSRRNFTWQCDILPALSGVAHIQGQEKNNILGANMGCFKLDDLCWRRLLGDPPNTEDIAHQDEDEYLSPSWSGPQPAVLYSLGTALPSLLKLACR